MREVWAGPAGTKPLKHMQKPSVTQAIDSLKKQILCDRLENSAAGTGCEFKIAVVYQDKLMRSWAMQMCGPVARRAGTEYVKDTWHDVNSLHDPQILIQAVHAALAADVIVVAVHAAEELPSELCAWIDVWLPRRSARAGAVVALVGVAGAPAAPAIRTQRYLQTVAHQAQLDFVLHERKLPAEH
jgi:hypothetical protein